MEIIQRQKGNVVILDIHGQISLGESKEKFARAMDKIFEQPDVNVLVNFESINYLDSTGIGELVGYMNKFVENNRHLKIYRPHERIRKLLKITKLDTIFEIYEDEEEALKSFSVKIILKLCCISSTHCSALRTEFLFLSILKTLPKLFVIIRIRHLHTTNKNLLYYSSRFKWVTVCNNEIGAFSLFN